MLGYKYPFNLGIRWNLSLRSGRFTAAQMNFSTIGIRDEVVMGAGV
jgi:hypothetical protein